MPERPYLPAIEALKLCQAALERILPSEERRIILGVHTKAVARLELLARSDDARVARINKHNEEKQISAEEDAAEKSQIDQLCGRYRANLRGRFTQEGAIRWIVANSLIPRKRVRRQLKAMTLGRGDKLSADLAAKSL
jgi:hypothetical protein